MDGNACNTDSLGEQIQRAFPAARVVKTLNTMNAMLMTDPQQVAGGDHTVFMSGNDARAKRQVADILTNWLGWKQVVDLGDITTARGTEMILPLWVFLMGVVGSPMFNFKIVKRDASTKRIGSVDVPGGFDPSTGEGEWSILAGNRSHGAPWHLCKVRWPRCPVIFPRKRAVAS